jgi:hypothetical protein
MSTLWWWRPSSWLPLLVLSFICSGAWGSGHSTHGPGKQLFALGGLHSLIVVMFLVHSRYCFGEMLSSLYAFLVEPPPATHLLTFLTIASLSLAIMRLFEPCRCGGRFCLHLLHCSLCRVALFCANILEGCAKKRGILVYGSGKNCVRKDPPPKNHVHSVGLTQCKIR